MSRKQEAVEEQQEEAAPECCLKPAAVAEPVPDPFAGHGGTYELNLLTGERQPVTKTEKV